MKKIVFSLLLPLFFLSCTSSAEKLEQKGEKIALMLAQDLAQVQTREDLLLLEPKLRKNFLKIVKIAKQAEHLPSVVHHEKKHIASDALKSEMIRVYREIDGGKEIIENAQREALREL